MNLLDAIQNVFQIVLNKQNEVPASQAHNAAIYIQFDQPTDTIIDEHLEAILFERLLMSGDDLAANTIRVQRRPTHSATSVDELKETNPMIYLFECYQRLASIEFDKQIRTQFRNVIVNQTNKYLINIYPTLEPRPLLVELLDKHYFEADSQLIREFFKALGDDEECELSCFVDVLKTCYYDEICSRVSKMEFSDPLLFKTVNFIKLLTSNTKLALAFIKLNSPWTSDSHFNSDLNQFQPFSSVLKTLVGHLLSISSLPKPTQLNFKYFNDAMNSLPDQIINLEQSIGLRIFDLVKEVHEIFFSMLKQKDVREQVLNYFGLVLYSFRNRSQIWSQQSPSLASLSDGFMLNFLHLILLLCKPFAIPYSDKLLKIDPRYCAMPSLGLTEINHNEMQKIHLRGLGDDACLVGKPEASSENQADGQADTGLVLSDKNNYNFMTEIFFLCHKAIQLGFKSTYDRFLALANHLSELTHAMEGGRVPNQEMLNQEMNAQLTKFYSTKTILCQTDFMELFAKFNMATATWLTNIAMHSEHLNDHSEQADDLTVNRFYPFKLKVDKDLEETRTSKLMQFIPEFISENVAESFIFSQRFADRNRVTNQTDFEPLITFILAYMASPQRMKNPHLRAKLTEVLEELRPKASQQEQSFRMGQMDYRPDVFKTYEHKQYLVPCLVHVFVSIELTGQSVAFEQKFQYRRSIYAVLEYLWNERSIKDIYRQSMIDLSNEAVRLIERPNPPLFLRFINLMSNDAIFVLDESLENMSKLKNLLKEKEEGKWNGLSLTDRREKEHALFMTERLARWSNMTSNMMVKMLYYLTTEIKDIFCHPIFVDRLVSMLNYFLVYLVGPKQKDFKVRSAKEQYFFDPAGIVFNISRIYVNLGILSISFDFIY